MSSKPHSSVSPKAMGLLGIIQEGFVGIGVGHTPSVDDSRAANRAVRELGAYILGLEEQYERSAEEIDRWMKLKQRAEDRISELEEQLETLRNALGIIADTVYPATFQGKRDDGTLIYGGSQDASRFAREVLDRISNPASTPDGSE